VAEVSKTDIDQAIQDFAQQNPEVVEALEVFGIATAEYERALHALYPSVSYTGSSTQPSR
jgi:outer membrane protein TolC